MKLYLIRHGESIGNQLGKIQGCQEFDLSPTGKLQAELVGSYLGQTQFDAIYSSQLTRAFETAVAIAGHQNVDVIKMDKAKEIQLGPFEGKTREEIYLSYPEAKEKSLLTSGVKGTETIEGVTKRCNELLSELLQKHQGQRVAVISHGGLINIFLMYVMIGENWHEHHRPFMINNTSISLLEWQTDRKPIIHYINSNKHINDTELI
jgi:uncharacterized phosphatase